MISCGICKEKRPLSIAEHIKSAHNISCQTYKERFHLPVKSEEYSKLVSDSQKKVWADLDYHAKMCESRQFSHRTIAFRKKQSEIIKRVYINGFKSWNTGLTKDDHPSIKLLGQKNSARIKGTKNPEHGKRMKKIWAYYKKYRPDEWKKIKAQQKNTITSLIASGKLKLHNQYKNGWHFSPKMKEHFYFMSSLEEAAMKMFDSNKNVVSWTTRHNIRIKYIDENKKERIYIPDFKIWLVSKEIALIETKGKGFMHSINRILKEQFARKIYKNYIVNCNVEFIEEKINEICKN